MPDPGDIVEFYSRIAGKRKYHICLCIGDKDGVYKFLMINSKSGFKSDVIFLDGEIPGLPKSPTGESVISLSQIARIKSEKLALWQPAVVGKIPTKVINALQETLLDMPTLTKEDKDWLKGILSKL